MIAHSAVTWIGVESLVVASHLFECSRSGKCLWVSFDASLLTEVSWDLLQVTILNRKGSAVYPDTTSVRSCYIPSAR